MNTGTTIAPPAVAIPRDCAPALRKGLKDTRRFYIECLDNLTKPNAQPEEHDAETFERWIQQLRLLELSLPGSENDGHELAGDRDDRPTGVEVYALREAARDVAKFRVDQFAYEVGAEHNGWPQQLETFAERSAALDEVSTAMELWETVFRATDEMADAEIVEVVIDSATT